MKIQDWEIRDSSIIGKLIRHEPDHIYIYLEYPTLDDGTKSKQYVVIEELKPITRLSLLLSGVKELKDFLFKLESKEAQDIYDSIILS